MRRRSHSARVPRSAGTGAPSRPDAVYVRDSKAAGDGPVPRVPRGEWSAFMTLAVK
ncbi:DUF397 domain-containing protein [Streptomyces sp. NPDC001348]